MNIGISILYSALLCFVSAGLAWVITTRWNEFRSKLKIYTEETPVAEIVLLVAAACIFFVHPLGAICALLLVASQSAAKRGFYTLIMQWVAPLVVVIIYTATATLSADTVSVFSPLVVRVMMAVPLYLITVSPAFVAEYYYTLHKRANFTYLLHTEYHLLLYILFFSSFLLAFGGGALVLYIPVGAAILCCSFLAARRAISAPIILGTMRTPFDFLIGSIVFQMWATGMPYIIAGIFSIIVCLYMIFGGFLNRKKAVHPTNMMAD